MFRVFRGFAITFSDSMGAVPRILLQEKQTDLLTPNGVRDSRMVSGVSREQIRLLKPKNGLKGLSPWLHSFMNHEIPEIHERR